MLSKLTDTFLAEYNGQCIKLHLIRQHKKSDLIEGKKKECQNDRLKRREGWKPSPKFPIPRGCFPEYKWYDSQRIACPVSRG